jgi:hypothetical protein
MARKKIEPKEELLEEVAVESVVEEVEVVEVVEKPVVEKPAIKKIEELPKKKFMVYDGDEELGEFFEGDKKLDEFQSYNINELAILLVDWKIPFNDVDCLVYNLGSSGRNYRSWTQYRLQNGLAPSDPPIKNMLEYYRVALNNVELSDEEVVVSVHKFRYSFLEI